VNRFRGLPLLVCCLLVGPFASAKDAALRYRIETIATELARPVTVAFLPDGDLLVTEKAGRLRRVHEGRLQPEPVGGLERVAAEGAPLLELLDAVPHPRFADNRWLYLAFVTGDRREGRAGFGDSEIQVGRARYGVDDGARLDDFQLLFSTGSFHSRPVHYAGRLAFMADGTLLLTTGDRSILRERAQALDDSIGKTLRIRDDGTIPPDNPFVGRDGALSAIWTYGHRNAQGLIVDTVTGVAYANEHGPQGGDELNRLEAGGNYGWPIATHGIDYSGGYITPFTEYPGVEPPLRHWSPSFAPSGLAQCRGCLWPAWEEDLFSGGLAGRQVRRVAMRDGVPGEQEVLFAELGERIRDVRFGPDGALYLLTDGERGRLLRVAPAGREREQR
jgi:glucose/arabinose dehydrogenase